MKKVYYVALGLVLLALGLLVGKTSSDQATTPLLNQSDQEAAVSATAVSLSLVPTLKPTPLLPAPTITDELLLYPVTRVVDGDTIKISIDGKEETVRLIGVDTPETVDPRKAVQCFGIEASKKTKEWLTGRSVRIETDTTQGERDKYARLLAYVYRNDGLFVNKELVAQGFAHEYTYNIPYKYQADFKEVERLAREGGKGLWTACPVGEVAPNNPPAQSSPAPASVSASAPSDSSCTIKGNINSSGEKIYHLPGCGSYTKTTIEPARGEQMFCTEADAQQAGWRKALNCS